MRPSRKGDLHSNPPQRGWQRAAASPARGPLFATLKTGNMCYDTGNIPHVGRPPIMARRALQPGELGNITTTKVSKQGKAWVVNLDGTHWRASVLVGRRGDTPKRVRTIATSKRQAVRQCEAYAQQFNEEEAQRAGVVTTSTTPAALWERYKATQRYAQLADRTRNGYRRAVEHSMNEMPSWWQLPLNEAITTSALTSMYDNFASRHGRTVLILRRALGVMLTLAADAVNLSPYKVARPTLGEITRESRLRLNGDRVLTPRELNDLVDALIEYRPRKISTQAATDALILQTHLGLRASELFALTWDHVNLETGVISGVASQKTGRTYPPKSLPGWQLARLKARAKKTGQQGPVFQRSKETLFRQSRAALTDVGYPDLSIHNIRKSVGSIIFDTYGARAAAAWLAHSNVQTTISYYVKLDGAMPEGPVDLLKRGDKENRQ